MPKRLHSNREGQTLVELALALPLLLALAAGTTALFRSEWNRFRCAYLVFETTREALNGGGRTPTAIDAGSGVSVRDEGSSLEGSASCGRATEKVRLPKLEYARWSS